MKLMARVPFALLFLVVSMSHSAEARPNRKVLSDGWTGDIDKRDGTLLLRAAEAFKGSFARLDTWNLSEPCSTWRGINCDPTKGGKVMNIRLNNLNLTGSIPDGFSKLYALRLVDLSYNYLEGSIPAGLGKLQKLNFVDLSNNKLTGSIPASFGRCPSLAALNLGNNALSGSIPSILLEPKYMEKLQLNDNRLTGPLPKFLTSMRKIQIFNVSSNFLSGTVPDSPIPPRRRPYIGLSNNFFYGKPNSTSDYCTDTNIDSYLNCFQVDETTSDCGDTFNPQRPAAQCNSFCQLKYLNSTGTFVPPCVCGKKKTAGTCTPSFNANGDVKSFSCVC